MSNLNEDILHHVVTFISSEELHRINSCNPVFYEAWMKSRYRSLTLVKRDKEMKRLLQHLRDPHVACHVKKIELKPWLVQPRNKTPQSKTENIIVKFLKVLDPHYTKKKAAQRLQNRLLKDTNNVLTAFKQMHRLEEYTINWDDNVVDYHLEFFKAFLAPALENWSGQLARLTVKVPPRMLDALARVRLPKLDTFVYHFCTGDLPPKEIADTHDGFIVFLNNLKDSLESLTFISTHTSQELDISRVFRMIGHFPLLSKVTLSIPFDGGHLSNPMTFVGFLEKHRSTLREINLFTSRCCVRSKQGDPEYINWLQRIIGSVDTPFPRLHSLAVALRPLRAPLDTLTRFLNLHASTLDSVTLTERPLGHDDLRGLFSYGDPVNPLANTLEALQFKTDIFSVSFLATLCEIFPNLKTLRVEFKKLKISRDVDLEYGIDRFSGWGLQQLSIGPSEYKWAQHVGSDLQVYLPGLHISDFDS